MEMTVLQYLQYVAYQTEQLFGVLSRLEKRMVEIENKVDRLHRDERLNIINLAPGSHASQVMAGSENEQKAVPSP